MKAEETQVANLFESKQQVRVPVWQRRYSWEKPDWDDLWDDIVRARDEAKNHFLGSFVFMAHPFSGVPSEAKRFDVVDGQQRTITVFLLVAALRDAIASREEDEEAASATFDEYTAQLLTNSNLQEGHRERLVLQAFDNPSFSAIVSGKGEPDPNSLVTRAYEYFRDALSSLDRAKLDATFGTILTRLEAVWVRLDATDNAHRVFQTLNAGGKPLRQSDLVRNYFFLLLGDEGEQFYVDQWAKMEAQISSRDLESYFSAWTISQGHAGSTGSIFGYFQRDLAPHETSLSEVLVYGSALVDTARLFSWIRNPEDCPITAARRSLIDLKNWGSLPAEGLILYLLRRNASGSLSSDALAACVDLVLSFMARRMLAGYEPNLHKSIFVGVTRKLRAAEILTDGDVTMYLQAVLSLGEDVRTWPTDDAVKHYAAQNPIYLKSRQHWVFGVLERINSSYAQFARHRPDALDRSLYQVEHVLPQALTDAWESDLEIWGAENPVQVHQELVHVLGNLTLTAINPHLHQKRFGEKKLMLQDDWLKLNSEIADLEEWSESQILQRSADLAARACDEYPGPLPALDARNILGTLGLSDDEEVSVDDEEGAVEYSLESTE